MQVLHHQYVQGPRSSLLTYEATNQTQTSPPSFVSSLIPWKFSSPIFSRSSHLACCPHLLISSILDRLLPTLNFLRHLGFVDRHSITCRTTILLVSSSEDTFIPKLEYLHGLGFSHWEI
ncbi:hypothetical protein ZIOFF_007959 [Zingiber officinale]|uniref:Uncharacterized protein n=1 Tax=Zingiber officinale TaxID=94328 RepID=A0A8J5HXY6_ZINOF|nr:hypothetical protein ZIOFF_007959 [Zingiber officinale]